MKFKTGYTLLLVAVVMLAVAMPLSQTSQSAAAVPIFTGDAPADFVGPDVIKVDDPSSGVGIPDVGMPDIYPDDQLSGWEMNAAYFEYDYSSDVLHVGIDCFGICGDADGDGDPGATGESLETLRGTDQPDFGGTESFTLLVDTNNDCDVNPNTGFEAVVGVALGSDITGLGAYNFVGTPFAPSTGFGAVLDNQVTLFANPSADSPDIEFSIANFSTLPGFEGDQSAGIAFGINIFMGSLDDDGIGEDYLPGAASCIPVIPPPPPADTPTPVPPTDTPEPPTPTPEPPTPTVPPTEPPPADTPTPTVPPTEPPPADTPTPVPPTPTMVPPTVPPPPPTDLPPTGPSAQEGTNISIGEMVQWGIDPEQVEISSSDAAIGQLFGPEPQKEVVSYVGPAPQRIAIDAIDLDSTISPMSWYSDVDQDGNSISQWQVVDFAVGWHINSASIGEPGNVVMSGHNSIGGSVFDDLSYLQSGDTVSVWDNDGLEHTYIVDQVRLVQEQDIDSTQQASNAQWLTDFGDERLTLVSCWPDFSSKYRVIVTAHPESASIAASNRPE